jgi:hypothetical protein
MEEKENDPQKKEPEKKENIYDEYQKEKDNSLSVKENQKINDQEKENKIESEEGENPQEKVKRRRRGKSEINDRKYLCPDCDKCYLSGPALTTHRKTKHGYGNSGEKSKRRGRPKKEGLSEGQNAQNIFNNFFNTELRKNNVNTEEKNEEKEVDLNDMKNNLIKIFNNCKEQIFKDINDINEYSFYNLIINNWDKKEEERFPSEERFCFSGQIIKGENPVKLDNTYNLDQLFFNYLKEFSKKTNEDYLWFMTKFIVLFRECINIKRKDLIKPENKINNRELYTQIYNAETVPEICNYFFLEFLEPYDGFGLNKDESIHLIQHFCYWLYINHYTQSHLTLLED